MRILNVKSTLQNTLLITSLMLPKTGMANLSKGVPLIHPQVAAANMSEAASKGLKALNKPVILDKTGTKAANILATKFIKPKNMRVNVSSGKNLSQRINFLYTDFKQRGEIQLNSDGKRLKLLVQNTNGHRDEIKLPNLEKGDYIIGLNGTPYNSYDSKPFQILVADKNGNYYKRVIVVGDSYTGVETNYDVVPGSKKPIFKEGIMFYRDGNTCTRTYDSKHGQIKIVYKNSAGNIISIGYDSIRRYH